jgi:hypothetical protein
MISKKRALALLACVFLALPLCAQNEHKHEEHQMAEKMPGMKMVNMNAAGMFLMNLSSGTASNPASGPMPMLMTKFGSWNTMFMAQAFLVQTAQSGPRGGDKLYSANWLMASVEHRVGERGSFQTQLMLSLEPATVTNRRYPLLFQTGETAYGRPLVDAQHPHDILMSVGIHYAHQLGKDTTARCLFRARRRPRARAGRLSAPRVSNGTAAGHLVSSLARLDSYRK